MSSICLSMPSHARTIASAWSKVVSLFLAINFFRMLSLYRPAIYMSINCSSLSVYSKSLAIMRALVMDASIVSFSSCFIALN